MTTPNTPAQEMWSDERINEFIVECLLERYTPRGLARRVAYAVRASYESARAQDAQTIARLTAELATCLNELIEHRNVAGLSTAAQAARYRELTGKEYGEDEP